MSAFCRYIVPGITGTTARRQRRRLRMLVVRERGQCGKPATHIITNNKGPLPYETLCPRHARAWDRLFGTVEALPTKRLP